MLKRKLVGTTKPSFHALRQIQENILFSKTFEPARITYLCQDEVKA